MILSDKYKLLRKNFRNFAETEFTTEIQEQLDREGGFNWDLHHAISKLMKRSFIFLKIGR